MFYCPNHKILFYAIPKTGTRTIYSFLERNFGGRLFKEHNATSPAKFKDYFTFTVIRNPYDRVCSQWWSTCKRGNDKRGNVAQFTQRGWDNSVKSWVRLRKERGLAGPMVQGSQTIFLQGNRIDQLLHFENLQEEFNTLPFLKTPTQLEWLNPTVEVNKIKNKNPLNNRPHWSSIMDQETIELVNEVYHMDFPTTGYPVIENLAEWKKNI